MRSGRLPVMRRPPDLAERDVLGPMFSEYGRHLGHKIRLFERPSYSTTVLLPPSREWVFLLNVDTRCG